MSDRHHRLRNALRILADSGSKPAAEQNDLHVSNTRLGQIHTASKELERLSKTASSSRPALTTIDRIECAKVHGYAPQRACVIRVTVNIYDTVLDKYRCIFPYTMRDRRLSISPCFIVAEARIQLYSRQIAGNSERSTSGPADEQFPDWPACSDGFWSLRNRIPLTLTIVELFCDLHRNQTQGRVHHRSRAPRGLARLFRPRPSARMSSRRMD